MSTINVKRVKATAPHKTTAVIRVPNDEGVNEEKEITIRYRGLSMEEAETFPQTDGLEGAERNAAVRQQLAFLITEIPEFVDDDGQPVATDEEFFKELDINYVIAINQSLNESRSIPTKPTDS